MKYSRPSAGTTVHRSWNCSVRHFTCLIPSLMLTWDFNHNTVRQASDTRLLIWLYNVFMNNTNAVWDVTEASDFANRIHATPAEFQSGSILLVTLSFSAPPYLPTPNTSRHVVEKVKNDLKLRTEQQKSNLSRVCFCHKRCVQVPAENEESEDFGSSLRTNVTT